MSCEKLRQNLDLSCTTLVSKYYQQLVLINRADVEFKQILTSYVDIEGVYTCRHRVIFSLFEGRTGYRFTVGENSTSIVPMFEKSEVDNIPQYRHSINMIVGGVSEEIKCLLKQLDYADYFAAVQFYDGTVEIYGFEFGMTTSGYGYDLQATGGGTVIKLQSLPDALEDEPPFVYGGDAADFDNNFANIIFVPQGDFNDDFNDDFFNQGS